MISATHPFQQRSLNPLDENGNEGCARCGRPRNAHPPESVPPLTSMPPTARESQQASAAAPAPRDTVHLMTIEMGAWCGATGPRFNGRASSAWREVTCTECLAKGATWLRSLVWDMLQAMPASSQALDFAVRAGRLGVTGEQGHPLVMGCAPGGDK